MNRPQISVIVPIYNVEEYLGRCIESIIAQSYRNYELLLIDDGSTDRSGKIADAYATKDYRIRVFHKENGGLSDARNYGLGRVKGKYITFIDSDDYVSETFLEKLLSNLLYFNADISGCVYRRTTQRNAKCKEEKNPQIAVWNSETALKKMLRQEDEFTTSACALLYKIECFKSIRYPKGAYFEDLGTTYLVLHNAAKIVRTSECLYYYYMREGSISNQKFQTKYMDQYKFARDIQNFIRKKYPNLSGDADARLIGVCFNIYMTFTKEQKLQYLKSIHLLKDTIKKYRKNLIISRNTPTKVRMACIMSYFGMNFCSFLYNKLGIKGK